MPRIVSFRSPQLPVISADKLRSRKALLLAVALAGFFGFNGVFLYYALLEPSMLAGALANPVAATFVAEALALTLLGAWLVHEAGLRRPGWIAFALLSLAGGLVFSVLAFTLWRLRRGRLRREDSCEERAGGEAEKAEAGRSRRHT